MQTDTAPAKPGGKFSPIFGLLLCLLGTLCVIGSFFLLPLYEILPGLGGGSITALAFAMEGIANMQAQGVSPGFLVIISVPFIPLIAAFVLGVYSFLNVVAAKPIYQRVFLGVWWVGFIPLLLFGMFMGRYVQVGYMGAMVGFALLLAGYMTIKFSSTSQQVATGKS